MLGQHLGGAALVAVLIRPVPELQAALHHGHAALGEEAGDKFGGAAPSHDVDEVRGFLPGLLVLEVPIHRQGKVCDRRPALRLSQLGIAGEAAHENNPVQHVCSSKTTVVTEGWGSS